MTVSGKDRDTPPRPRRRKRPLTAMQEEILATIMACGPCDAHEINRNFPCAIHGLGAMLGGLEKRGLIGRDYTSQRYTNDYGYIVTATGREVCGTLFGDAETE